MRANDHIDAIALAGGEADETRHIEADLAAVLAAMRRLVMGLTNLTWITAGSGWITIVAPIIAAAPLYFAGKITFGGLMLASGAFMQVQSSLRWFVDNFSTIADWRATLLRVAMFRRAMIGEVAQSPESRITIAEGDPGEIRIEQLAIATLSGTTRLVEPNVQIERGDRVLIVGESGARKTLVFRALAGLWPLGAGTITPPEGRVDHVHAAHGLSAAAPVARGLDLSVDGRDLRHAGVRRRIAPPRARAARRTAQCVTALGPSH